MEEVYCISRTSTFKFACRFITFNYHYNLGGFYGG